MLPISDLSRFSRSRKRQKMTKVHAVEFFLAVAFFIVPCQTAYPKEDQYLQATVSPAEVADWPAPKITDNAARYVRALKERSSQSGKAPTLDELRHLMEPSCSLTRAEYASIRTVFLKMQHPKLSFGDIRRLRSALRDTITTVDFEWEVELGPINNTPVRFGKYRFLMDSNKLMFESKAGPELSEPNRTHLRSYDGSSETVYDADVLGGQAVVQNLVATSYYFKWHNPLWLAKLIDSKKYLGRSKSGLEMENLDNRWAYPLEELVEFHGRMCVVLLEQEDNYFLDPSMNYAYCGLQAGRYEFDEKLGRLVSDGTYRTEVLDDFKDCGDGLWLPMKAIDTAYKDGVPVKINTVRVLKAEVNVPIDSDRFVNVVPKGTEVVNGLNGSISVVGKASPEAALDAAIQPRFRGGFRVLIIAINVCLLPVLAYLLYRRHRHKAA